MRIIRDRGVVVTCKTCREAFITAPGSGMTCCAWCVLATACPEVPDR
jgi:hypothetical protein